MEPPDHMIYNMFIFLKFEIFSNSHFGAFAESFRENCSESREIKIFFKNLNYIGISKRFPLKRCIICLCYGIGSQMNGGGEAP